MTSFSKLRISYNVTRGKNAGTTLTPHINCDGAYTVSKTRFEKDYLSIKDPDDVMKYLDCGYKIRMSTKGHAPSLITKSSLTIESTAD